MKKFISFFTLLFLTYSFAIAQPSPPKLPAWLGTYRGFFPCADCEGIEETVMMQQDMHFVYHVKYIGREKSGYNYLGEVIFNKDKNTLKLTAPGKKPQFFLIGDNMLTKTDSTGNIMDAGPAGQFILSKAQYNIADKYWKLIELDGKPVKADSVYRKEPNITFDDKDYRVNGNAGCNNFSGFFILKGADGISISKIAITKMACPFLDVETGFLKAINDADSYAIVGDNLIMKKQGLVIAKFKSRIYKIYKSKQKH